MTRFPRSYPSMKRGLRGKSRRAFSPEAAIERLGDRILPATFVVQSAADFTGGTYEVKPIGNDTFEVPFLRAAILEANAVPGPDTIRFTDAVLGQTITLIADDLDYPTDFGHTALVVTESVVIEGYSQGTGTKGITIDGAGQRRIFAISPGVVLSITDVSLTNGFSQGGAGAPTWLGAGGGGGAGLGGAIYAYNATVNLTNVTITNSTAQGGAGGSIWDNAGLAGGGGGSAAFTGGTGGGTGDGSGGGGGGGGMYGPGQNANGDTGGSGGKNEAGKQAGQSDSGSLGGGGGGGRFYNFGSLLSVAHSGGAATRTNRFGFGGGGGGGAQGEAMFGGGHGGQGGFGAGGGGAGYNGTDRGGAGGFGGGGGGGTGTSNAGGSLFGGGSGGNAYRGQPNGPQGQGGGGGGGAGLGGAIFLNRSTLNMVNTTITGNSANGGAGGGAGIWSTGGNGGSGYGGAIFALNSTTNIQSSTIANNGASSGGNQVYVLSMGAGATSTAYLANSIVGRSDSSGHPDIIHRAIRGGRLPHLSGIANLISVPGRFPKRAIAATGDPMLGQLADNGGTTMTLKPLAGSPVIDAGSTRIRPRFGVLPAMDQTGAPRVQGSGPDIGAVETKAGPVTNMIKARSRRRK